ncbi:hypothetical protein Cni_G23580 [Canna indica]|uniref:Neuronal PAS domain protein n=1 Tax=Canna indica TaxID=4628 RepID=A0AAQ3KU48_9LILI|nr:hypothetical protein Cni_G23580 [Canna indica]
MASNSVVDVWRWISNLPSFSQWSTNSMSLCICTSNKTSLKLSITRSSPNQNPFVSFSIYADFHTPIPLWTSNPIHLKSQTQSSLTEDEIAHLFFYIVNGVLKYSPCQQSSFKLSQIKIRENFGDVLNLAFITLTFLICIYEAPHELRCGCLDTVRLQLLNSRCTEALKLLVRMLGSNLEEQWMRSLNLGVTNWISELQFSNHLFRTPLPLFSYALSASGLWKVQLYCPVIAMGIEDPSATTQDERLQFSLRYQQLEGVIQLAYKAIMKGNWIDIVVAVDNIRCDVNPLVSETLMNERGYGSEEKHFPSRISLQLTPTLQSDVMSVSVSKSSDNPTQEIGLEKATEWSFDPPNSYLGLKISAAETITMSMKPWKFEQSVYGNSANLHWFLHDGVNGREVFSSKPSKLSLLQPRTWFRDRYSTVYRPFTKQGGVIFAGDEYGESVWWKVCPGALGKTMEWEIKGSIWLTYWPNKQRTFYSETRRLQFKELVHLTLPKAP